MPDTTHPSGEQVNPVDPRFARCQHGIGGAHQHSHGICPGPTTDDEPFDLVAYQRKMDAAQRRWDAFYANPANGYC